MKEFSEEFSFRMSILIDAFQKRFLDKIPTSLLKKLDVDEQGSLLLGLLCLEEELKKQEKEKC